MAMFAWDQALPSERSHSNRYPLKLQIATMDRLNIPSRLFTKNKLFFNHGPGTLTNKAFV
jgi:hypothetical protein